MTGSFHRRFTRAKWLGLPVFRDEEIELIPKEYQNVPYTQYDCKVYVFHICHFGQSIGEIALRIGEGDALYYLGHIGYHVDPPYRGRHFAARACELVKPLFRYYGMNSFVITTDVDNIPSIRTCERVSCEYESTVPVPSWCQKAYETGLYKKRFIGFCNNYNNL